MEFRLVGNFNLIRLITTDVINDQILKNTLDSVKSRNSPNMTS